jgi:hypothetical protein
VKTSSQSPGKVTADFNDTFITNFRLLSAANKIPNLPNKEAFPIDICPINVKNMDNMKQVMKLY